MHSPHPSPNDPARIELFGEPEFPAIRVGGREVPLTQLSVSDKARGLVEEWLELVREGTDDDAAVLAGVRAVTAVARERWFTTPVKLSMRYPSDGDWFGLDAHNPGDWD